MLKTARAAIVTALATAAVFVGIQLAQSAPAHAATNIPTAPCSVSGVTDADNALAQELSPKLKAKLSGHIDGYQVSCARSVVEQVKHRGLDQRAATIALATTIVEGNIHNYNLAVDYDSLGLYQQRPSAGWGTASQITDPAHSTDAFLDGMIKAYPHDGWKNAPVGDVAQKVQISAFPGRYQVQADDAATISAALWG
ncbi:MAG TPA: hypothetical protein VF062_02070 [Candidatus Limnocylindrales bacterium]